ncbi:MAG: hypothetical protein PGN13_02460 [Patulibacter minatonensis]
MPITTTPLRRVGRMHVLVACAALAAPLLVSPAAEAKRQQVDLYTAYVELKVDNSAYLKETGWSQVVTNTILNGTIHARVDGLTFVDGVPQQTTVPFASSNATDLYLSQQARYTSPDGNETGDCDEAAREGVPLVPGQIATTIGATDADGHRRIAIDVQSPEQVWIHKTCTGYLKYEVADPLLKDPVKVQQFIPVTEIGRDFALRASGHAPCPNFIRIFNCDPLYTMTVEFEHTDRYEQGEPDPPQPLPPLPPAPGIDATDAEHEAFNLALMVRMAKEDRYGQAVVRCGKPCEGGVSAYAIALSKQGAPKGRPRKLATTDFRSDANGNTTAKIKLGAAQRRAAHQLGGIEFRAEARPIGGGKPVRSKTYVRLTR